MEKKCSRCRKPFNSDWKVIKSIDTDGNELHSDFCDKCELETMTEEVMELKHISREEADKYVIGKVNEMMDEAIRNIEPELFNSAEYPYKDYWETPFITPFIIGRFDNLVKVVKDNG
jgi:hypothetical protein